MIALSATNPCHLFDLAIELHGKGQLGAYHSGYPRWRLSPPAGFPIRAHSWRTLLTYAALRLPMNLRPKPHDLFRWQDTGFDRATASALRAEDGRSIHAMPGQALATFRRGRELGITCVLNHATGPVRQQLALIEPEYRRAGVVPDSHHGFDPAYFAREQEEYDLADFHCVASTVVRDQLVQEGVATERIWVIPYAADSRRFRPPASRQQPRSGNILFAGQLTLRKGLRTLLDAVAAINRGGRSVGLDLYGPERADIAADLATATRSPWLRLHGAVSQEALATAMQSASVLVLPSWEEGFGLVVPQALNCGLPCIVSDRVGAKDIIRHRRNGSVFPVGDAQALAMELDWWLAHPTDFSTDHPAWSECADRLLNISNEAIPA